MTRTDLDGYSVFFFVDDSGALVMAHPKGMCSAYRADVHSFPDQAGACLQEYAIAQGVEASDVRIAVADGTIGLEDCDMEVES